MGAAQGAPPEGGSGPPRTITWERYGDRRVDSRLPPSLDPATGHLWYGGLSAYPFYGVLRLRPPFDSTATWEIVARELDTAARGVLVLGPDTLLGVDGHYHRSTDGGATWTDTGHTARPEALLVVPPGLPHAGRIVAAHLDWVAEYSDDGGATWTAAAPGDDTTFAAASKADDVAVVTAGPNAGRLVAAGPSGLTVSDDGGATWAPTAEWRYFGMGAGCVVALRGAAPGGGDRVLSVVNDPAVPTSHVYVTVSDDGGDTWRRTASLRYGTYPTCAAAVDLGGGRAAAVMLRGPVWGTEDGGETWAVWSEGHPVAPGTPEDEVRSAWVHWAWVGPDGRLYVGVYQNTTVVDAWDVRSSEPVASWATAGAPGAPSPEAAGLVVSVRPNPSGGRVEVAVRLGAGASPAEVAVEVVDLQGRVVRAVGGVVSGERTWPVETAGLAAGAYVVRAVAGAEAATARLVVAR